MKHPHSHLHKTVSGWVCAYYPYQGRLLCNSTAATFVPPSVHATHKVNALHIIVAYAALPIRTKCEQHELACQSKCLLFVDITNVPHVGTRCVRSSATSRRSDDPTGADPPCIKLQSTMHAIHRTYLSSGESETSARTQQPK